MTFFRNPLDGVLIFLAAMIMLHPGLSAGEDDLPAFGRDTVLVWESSNSGPDSRFVVRIAIFSPDRFLEWESEKNQGTVYMPSRDIRDGKGFVTRNLFEGGVDKKSKNNTTVWLSRRIYRELKSDKKAKCRLDGVGGKLEYLGQDSLSVQVNGVQKKLPVIKASDGLGSEFWFLDREENPLMVKHVVRNYTQTLTVISTDRPNTLRWIKGEKLANPPQRR
jgi:hypothetical protein